MISYIINNQASKCKRSVFVNTLLSVTRDISESDEIIVVDDSGEEFNNGYYQGIKALHENLHIIINKENQNLLRSRAIGFQRSKGEWIRFIDSGDEVLNTSEFTRLMKLESSDLVLLNQEGLYYCVRGLTYDYNKILIGALSGLMCCTNWSHVYKRDLLYDTFCDIESLNGNKLPHLFHTEDYLMTCIYVRYCKKIKALSNTLNFIKYDLTGASSARKVTESQLDMINKDLNIVKKTILESYKGIDINSELVSSLVDMKISGYIKRFH